MVRTGLQLLPLDSIDAGIAKNPGQKASAHVSSVWVRNTDSLQALLHELVSASGVRPFKSHSPKIEYEILTPDRSDSRHQATSRTTRSIPSTVGTGSWRDKRNSSHSSITSSSSSRQSSKDAASAHTPTKPGMEP